MVILEGLLVVTVGVLIGTILENTFSDYATTIWWIMGIIVGITLENIS